MAGRQFWTRKLIVALVVVFFATGFLTASAFMSWYLLVNPDIRRAATLRLIADIFTVILAICLSGGWWWMQRDGRPVSPLVEALAERDAEIRRRRDAKRWNESIKLLANLLNTIGASSFLALFVVPMLTQRVQFGASALYGLAIAGVCHLLGQTVLRLWKTEE